MSYAALEQAVREIQADKKIPSDVRKADPFSSVVAVSKIRNTKHANTILACLGRLINDEALSHDQLKSVLECFEALSNGTQDIQLKVLQTLPLILSADCPTLTGANLVNYLTIPLSLVQSPNIVGSIANATLQQIMVNLFDKPSESREADVTRIFEDLCAGYRGQQVGTISFGTMNKNSILELLESIFASDRTLFVMHPSLIDADLLPILIDTIRDVQAAFPTLMRVTRISSQLLSERSELLEVLLETLPAATPWKQALILETLESCSTSFSEKATLQIVNALSYFEDALPGLGSYETCSVPRLIDEQVTSEGVIYAETTELKNSEGLGEWCCPPRRLSTLLNATQAPPFKSQYISLMVFKVLINASTSPLHAWQGLLLMFSAFLSSSVSQPLEQILLDTYLRITITLDAAGETRPRDAFIRRIGRIAVRTSMVSVTRDVGANGQVNSNIRDPSHRTFACLGTFVSIVESVCQELDVSAWRQVLEILNASDALFSLQRQRRHSHSGSLLTGIMQEERKSMRLPQFAAEISHISSRVDLLWQNSNDLSDESFTALLTSLCTPQVETPGSPIADRSNGRMIQARNGSFDSTATSQNSVNSTEDNYGFVLETMKAVVARNMFRFVAVQPHAAWTSVVQFLQSEIHNDNLLAAETLASFINDAVQQSLSSESQQLRFLHAADMISGDDILQAIQLQSLSVILESIGHDLICGWDIILSILHHSIGKKSTINLDTIRVGFSCLQMICTDFMGRVPEAQLPDLIDTVIAYAAQEASMNIALGSTALLWNILDRLPTTADFEVVHRVLLTEKEHEGSCEAEHLWLVFMEHLRLIAIDGRSEIRNSVLQICRRTIMMASAIGPRAFLSSVHLMLDFLFTIPDQLLNTDAGTVETTSNIVTTARQVLQVAEKILEDVGCVYNMWKNISNFLHRAMSFDNVAVVAATIEECSALLQVSEQDPRSRRPHVWDCQWHMVVSGGRNMLRKQFSSSTLAQESLSKYVSLLEILCDQNPGEMSAALLKEILTLVSETIQYTNCKYYSLDIDHLSTEQKAAFELLQNFFKRFPQHRNCLFTEIGGMLQLAASAELRASKYAEVSSSSSIWSGRPTFIALTCQLLQLVNAEYTLEDDPTLASMVALLDGTNTLINSHTSRASIANKGIQYEVWKTATDRIIDFVILIEPRLANPQTLSVWPQLLLTVDNLMRPHVRATEEFVLSRLNVLCPPLVVRLDSQTLEHRIQYIETLYRSSWFHTESELIQTSTIVPEHYDDQIIREWCFLELLKLPLNRVNDSTSDASPVTTASTEVDKDSLALCALPYVIRRAKNILSRYINNAALRANAPLSQLERNEMFLLLDHLGDESIDHANQRELIRHVYSLVVDSLTISQNNPQLFAKLKNVLLRVAALI